MADTRTEGLGLLKDMVPGRRSRSPVTLGAAREVLAVQNDGNQSGERP
jgi:hypothetical protein